MAITAIFIALKKGYSGVGTYSRCKPDNVVSGLGIPEIDAEGRYLRLDFGRVSVISVYFPSGSSGEHRQAAKFFFLERFFPMLKQLADCGREIILCGDWNIAHKEIDLKTGDPIRKIPAFSRKNAPGLLTFSTNLDLSTYSVKSIRSLSNIRGGPIEGRHGQKMWAGVSIIRLRPPELPPRPRLFPFIRRNGFPIIHRLLSTTTTAYDPESGNRSIGCPASNAGFGLMPAALSGWLHAFRIYTHPRVLGMLSLGFSAGLPLLLVLGTLSFWLREAGIDRSTIGHLSWIGLAYGFKWMWSPWWIACLCHY